MKTILKTVIVTACVSTAMFLASCGSETKKENNHEHSGSDNHDEHIYTCSMHPEVVGKKGDKCPTCEMDLIEKK